MSTQPSTKVGTFTLSSSSFTISVDMGIKSLALKLGSGTVTYAGTLVLTDSEAAGLQSTAITLDSQGFQVSGDNPIDGLVIDASSGVVIISVIQP